MATWARCGRRRAHHVINNFDNRTLCSQRTCNVTKSRENGAVCCLRQDYGEDPYFGRHNLPSNTVYLYLIHCSTVPDRKQLQFRFYRFGTIHPRIYFKKSKFPRWLGGQRNFLILTELHSPINITNIACIYSAASALVACKIARSTTEPQCCLAT